MRKGQTALLGIMFAVMLLLVVVVLIEPVKEGIDIGRTALSCGTPGLGVGVSMTCIVTDWYLPLFIGFGIAVALSFIGLRRLRQGQGEL